MARLQLLAGELKGSFVTRLFQDELFQEMVKLTMFTPNEHSIERLSQLTGDDLGAFDTFCQRILSDLLGRFEEAVAASRRCKESSFPWQVMQCVVRPATLMTYQM